MCMCMNTAIVGCWGKGTNSFYDLKQTGLPPPPPPPHGGDLG